MVVSSRRQRRNNNNNMAFGYLFQLFTLLSFTCIAVQASFAAFQSQPKPAALRQASSSFGNNIAHRSRRRVTTSSRLAANVESVSATTTDVSSSTNSLTLFSPCKINLFLRILRRREDGYHDLASLFQAVGFGDTLELERLDEPNHNNDDDGDDDTIEFSCNMEGVPVDSTNLVVRAIQLMKDQTGRKASFRANLIKQVPAQAGLGGGSANAATAMWGVNELLGRPATLEQMVEWSGALGSDITFFLSRGTAYCTGRGEIMTPLDPPFAAGTKLCIVKFNNVGLSTPAVFKALEYDKLSTLDPDVMLQSFQEHQNNDMKHVPPEYFLNDLEFPAFKCVPQLETLKEELQAVRGFTTVMMSGSGTSIFCLGMPDDVPAFEKQFMHDRDDLQVFFTEFINRPEGVWFERQS